MTIFIWPFQNCPNFSSFWLLSHQRVFQCVLNNKELIAHPGQAESMWESLQLFSKHDLCIWFKSWVWGSTIRKPAVCFLLSLEIKKRIFHWAHDIVHICWQHGGCGYPLRGTVPDDYITTRFQFLVFIFGIWKAAMNTHRAGSWTFSMATSQSPAWAAVLQHSIWSYIGWCFFNYHF